MTVVESIPGTNRNMSVELVQMIEESGIRPGIAHAFEWVNAKQVVPMLLAQNSVGKLSSKCKLHG